MRSILIPSCLLILSLQAFTAESFGAGGADGDCEDLIKISDESDVSAEARGLAVLIQQMLAAQSSQSLHFKENLEAALQSPMPINMFLNVVSYQGLAFAQTAEPRVANLNSSDWKWLQGKLGLLLHVKQEESLDRDRDSQQTAGVSSWQHVSFSAFSQSLVGNENWETSSWHGRPLPRFLGTVRGIHLFRVKAQTWLPQGSDFLPDFDFGLVAVSMAANSKGPVIQWLVRHPQTVSTKFTQEAELSSVNMKKMWLVYGRLFLVTTDKKTKSEALLEMDPGTGAIIQRFVVPAKGRIEIWGLDNDQIIAANFDGIFSILGRSFAKRFFRFDPGLDRFSPTGLDIGFLKSRRVIQSAGEILDMNSGLMMHIPGHLRRDLVVGGSGSYMTDGSRLLIRTRDSQTETWENIFGLSNLHKWSPLESVGAVNSEVQGGGGTLLSLAILESLRETAAGKVQSENTIPPAPSVRTLEIAGPRTVESIKRLKFSIFDLPGTNMNIVYVSGELTPESAWVIDRDSLEVTPLQMPKGQPLAWDLSTGQWTDRADIFHANNSLNQHLLIWADKIEGLLTVWTLNPSTLQFEGPEISGFPAGTETGELSFSEDSKSVVARSVSDGIWIRRKLQLRRGEEL